MAILAGALRIISTFAGARLVGDYAEVLYLLIDVGLLGSVLAAYLSCSVALGTLGFVGFGFALVGAASIVGPDGAMFGAPIYQVGGGSMVVGLALVAAAQLRARINRVGSSLCWLMALVAAGFSTTVPVSFMILGVVFGLGFMALGLELLREAKAGA